MKHLSSLLALSLTAGLMVGAEFLPIPLLTPMAHSLRISPGACGQSVAVSSVFAIIASLGAPLFAAAMDMRRLLVCLTLTLILSLVVGAMATELYVLMASRALLGLSVGAFWALATSLLMRLFPREQVGKALSFIYTGNAFATGFLPALAAWLGGLVGWRGVFGLFAVPLALAVSWLAMTVPALPPVTRSKKASIEVILRRPVVFWSISGFVLSFGGIFEIFTYWRPVIQDLTDATGVWLTLAFLVLGISAFIGTACADPLVKWLGLYKTRVVLPAVLVFMTLAFLLTDHRYAPTVLGLLLWGTLQSIIPITASLWVATDIADAPEAAGGLMNACIQGAIMSGSFIGGFMLDHFGVTGVTGAAAGFFLFAAVVFAHELSRRRPPVPLSEN